MSKPLRRVCTENHLNDSILGPRSLFAPRMLSFLWSCPAGRSVSFGPGGGPLSLTNRQSRRSRWSAVQAMGATYRRVQGCLRRSELIEQGSPIVVPPSFPETLPASLAAGKSRPTAGGEERRRRFGENWGISIPRAHFVGSIQRCESVTNGSGDCRETGWALVVFWIRGGSKGPRSCPSCDNSSRFALVGR